MPAGSGVAFELCLPSGVGLETLQRETLHLRSVAGFETVQLRSGVGFETPHLRFQTLHLRSGVGFDTLHLRLGVGFEILQLCSGVGFETLHLRSDEVTSRGSQEKAAPLLSMLCLRIQV